MRDTDHMPIISRYTIHGASGHTSMSGPASYDVQATAWTALEAVTAERWERLELRQRRAGVFELEGFSERDRRSGVYILTLGEVPLDAPAQASRVMSNRTVDAPMLARTSPRQRASWAEWIPGAAAALTRAELVAAVNRELDEPISAAAIAEWEREGVLPIPVGDPARRSYPEAAQQVVLLLISLAQAGRAHFDILEALRSTARDLHADTAPAVARSSGG